MQPIRLLVSLNRRGWSRDVTIEIADELRRRYVEYDEVPASILKFLGNSPAGTDRV
jgi:hypothetical protein